MRNALDSAFLNRQFCVGAPQNCCDRSEKITCAIFSRGRSKGRSDVEVTMKNMRTMRFTRTALKNLFSPPVTRPYPEQPREYPERTRGHVEIDIDTCILCGLCSRKCPTGAITVNRAEKTWKIERFGCIQCGCCVETCPKKCLTMKNAYTQPGAEKVSDTFLKTNMPAPAAKPAAKPQEAGTVAKPAGQAAAKPGVQAEKPKGEEAPAQTAKPEALVQPSGAALKTAAADGKTEA